MSHSADVYLRDIVRACDKVLRYVAGQTKEAFQSDEKTVDAVVRNLGIIGEPVERVPPEVRQARAHIRWKRMAGLRDIVVHDYAGVDLDIVWDIVQNKVPELPQQIRQILGEQPRNSS